jgi:hypothetical protein
MLEDYIMNLKFPLIAFYNIIMNENIDDINTNIFVKYFFNYHMKLCIEHNLLYFKNELKPLTYNTIYDIYIIISRQQSIVPHIIKFKEQYNNMYFWKLDIDKQIEYLKNVHLKFLSYFDASKSMLYYHVKLKQMIDVDKPVNGYHVEDMVDRLKKTYSLFKYSFFEKNDIIIVSLYEFVELSLKNMIKYIEYIFNKINMIMKQIITYFELYNNYRQQLINILYDNNMLEITYTSEIDSDIDINDMQFINSNK